VKTLTLAAAVLTLAISGAASAQSSPAPRGEGLRMPYQKDFWGYTGLSLGRARPGRCPGGVGCDDLDRAPKLFAGVRANNSLGFEPGLADFGRFRGGGLAGETRGLDLSFTAGVALGASSSVFGKFGSMYARPSTTGGAPGLRPGRESGWGPRLGLGAQVGLSSNWALRADWDRYRPDFPGRDENVDALSIGAQYNFR
jgi:opacity protein-like surface antigen